MSNRITCYTLFNITRTGVLNRARPGDDVLDHVTWYKERNTQCNFDTILQVISLRAQPDILTFPKQISLTDHKFGNRFKKLKNLAVWSFDFEVQQQAVFDDEITELGYLYKDCQGVPMVKCDIQNDSLDPYLDVTESNSNIYFVKYLHD